MSLADEVLSRWAPIVRAVELVSGSHGTYDITLDGEVIFSKKGKGRFPKPGEVAGEFEKTLGPPLDWRQS